MKLSIIILSYNTKALLEKTINSIFKQKSDLSFQVCVVDNASSDGSAEMIVKKFPQVRLLENSRNLGFSGGVNTALEKIKADYYLLLNSDVEVKEDAIDKLVAFAAEGNYGISGCKLINKDGSFQPNAGDLPVGLPLFVWLSGLDDVLIMVRNFLPSFHRKFKNYYKDGSEVGWISGTAMLITKEVIDKIGMLDENIFMYGEDTEYCLRAKRSGFKIGWTDRSTIMHIGGASSSNPRFNQWVGEFRGLLYIYGKYFGALNKMLLKLTLLLFTLLRMIAFFAIGKGEIAKTYGKVLVSL